MHQFLPHNRLYHYRSFETAKRYIFPDYRLRLNSIKNTNDPRENKSFIFSSVSQGNYESWEKTSKDVSDFLRHDCKTLCFSDDDEISRFWGYSKSRMWALYGGNHKGVCLGLDKNEFILENPNIMKSGHLKKITYHDHHRGDQLDWKTVDCIKMEKFGKDKYLKEVFRNENLDYLFFTKNIEWASEDEIRLIYFSDKIEDEYCSIRNSLKKIYLGVDFEDSKVEEITKLCPNVDIHRLEFQGFTMIPLLVYEGKK